MTRDAAPDEASLATKPDWRVLLAARAGAWLVRLLASTWRVRVRGGEGLESLRAAGTPFVFAFWHGQILPLLSHHRHQDIAMLVSAHRDGEIVARIGMALGYRTVRGSSNRGAGRALLSLVRELERGREVTVSPDGPRGPARQFAPGALIAAQRTGAAILPVAAHAARAWRLRSWDGFMIPKPFTRLTVAYGPPAWVAATTARDAALESARFSRLIDDAEEAARRA